MVSRLPNTHPPPWMSTTVGAGRLCRIVEPQFGAAAHVDRRFLDVRQRGPALK
jgi:hypothetical protein